MSFGPSNTTKTAENNLSGVTSTAVNDLYPKLSTAGGNLLNIGSNTAQPGINYFTNLLSGNRANTAATLAPNLNQIRDVTGRSLTGINTLMPRGGGRGATNYAASYAPASAVTNLFTNARSAAASPLINAGLQQEGLGANLFNLAGNALNTGGTTSANMAQLAQADTRRSDSLIGGIGSTLMGLALAPAGGGASVFSKLLGV